MAKNRDYTTVNLKNIEQELKLNMEKKKLMQSQNMQTQVKSNPENTFDNDLSPKNIGDLRSQELQLESRKLDIADKYLSLDIDQKTEITLSERTLLSALEIIADNPYSISANVGKGYPDMNNFPNQLLKSFIKNYFRLGIPVGRKGRKEESDVLTSVFGSTQIETMPNMNQDKKLIRG